MPKLFFILFLIIFATADQCKAYVPLQDYNEAKIKRAAARIRKINNQSKDFLIIFFLCGESCVACNSELNYAWVKSHPIITNNTSFFTLCTDEFGNSASLPMPLDTSIIILEAKKFPESKEFYKYNGYCAGVSKDDSIIFFYKIGSTEGFSKAYHTLDSIFYEKSIYTYDVDKMKPIYSKILIPDDTSFTSIPRLGMSCSLEHNMFQLFDNISMRAWLFDSLGNSKSKNQLSNLWRSQNRDSIYQFSSFYYLSDTSALATVLLLSKPNDTIIFNQKAKLFTKVSENFVSLALRKDSLISWKAYYNIENFLIFTSRKNASKNNMWVLNKTLTDKDSTNFRFYIATIDSVSFIDVDIPRSSISIVSHCFAPFDTTCIIFAPEIDGKIASKSLYNVSRNGKFIRREISYYNRTGTRLATFVNSKIITINDKDPKSNYTTVVAYDHNGIRESPVIRAPANSLSYISEDGKKLIVFFQDVNKHLTMSEYLL